MQNNKRRILASDSDDDESGKKVLQPSAPAAKAVKAVRATSVKRVSFELQQQLASTTAVDTRAVEHIAYENSRESHKRSATNVDDNNENDEESKKRKEN